MDNYIQPCEDSNVYQMFSQSQNYNVHGGIYSPEHGGNQLLYPHLIPENNNYDTVHGQVIYENSPFYENVSQLNTIQYTPLTPDPVPYPVFHLEPRPKQNHYMGKKHRAQITILPSSKGTFKAVVKRKRKRTVFTTEQIEALEQIFKTKQYITREERQVIVNNLQLNDKAVKIWFQNRRLKTKRMQEEDSEEQEDYPSTEYTNEERSSPEIARLDSVESEIRLKTDEFGFVTLDDGVMGDLATVIDDFLTKSNIDIPVEKISTDSSPVYEPISPASITDSSEDSSMCWRPSEPNESLQRLFDLQTMLL
uniref:Homeobox domain-containing protein n=1 Tax=Heliothis virescens TaxID=7102 RepID=A0A2A4IVV6_HELVI